jgi:cation diffusion facilitator family transporter
MEHGATNPMGSASVRDMSRIAELKRPTAPWGTRRVVFLSFALDVFQTVALAVAATLTGSSALLAQTFAAAASVGVQLFLVVGVLTSTRAPDTSHPLGYGRERFFWALYAGIGIFVAGFAVAFEEALHSIRHPTPVTAFTLGYLVLGISVVLDGIAVALATCETRVRAETLGLPVRVFLRHTTEPATVTELVGNGIGLTGGVVAIAALAITQATGSTVPDAIASGLIGVALIAAAIVLTQKSRSLLTGRGIRPELLARMQALVAAEPGVVGVPDFFAVVVGPATFVVIGDVTFADDLSVPEVEGVTEHATAALKSRWPEVAYVYLTPVASERPRRIPPAP